MVLDQCGVRVYSGSVDLGLNFLSVISLSKDAGQWPAQIRHIERLGSDTLLYVDVPELGALTVRADGNFDEGVGQLYI